MNKAKLLMSDKRFVYCTCCGQLLGEESDDAFILRDIYFEDNVTYHCKKCHDPNEWVSVNERLRREAATAHQKQLEAETKLSQVQEQTLTQINSANSSVAVYKQQLDKEKADHAATKTALAAALVRR